MIDINYIKDYFPKELHTQRLHMLREYLQYVMLEIIFDSPLGKRLTFLGGTCLRIAYNSQRFSEDLDFDNDNLTEDEFSEIKLLMERELTLRGYDVEVVIKGKTAYRCEVKYLGMLRNEGLSTIREEKLLIQIDTQSQDFTGPKEHFILNKFGIISQIPVTPMEVIFSQKCYAILNRPRNKGRDFYDLVYLISRNVKPNYAYLEQKLGIGNAIELKKKVLEKYETLDINGQIEDVQGFLFNKKDEQSIQLFGQIFKNAPL